MFRKYPLSRPFEGRKRLADERSTNFCRIINRQAYPLSRQLDSSAGEMVLRRIEALGVKVHTNVNVKDMLVEPLEGSEGIEVFKGFEFDDGEVVGQSRFSILPCCNVFKRSSASSSSRGGSGRHGCRHHAQR